VIVEIVNTTDSMYAFRRTNSAALAPGNLEDITVPIGYVWSTRGDVPEATVDRLDDEIAGLSITESETFQAHLEDPGTVVSALEALQG
jgi:hypothetical protein